MNLYTTESSLQRVLKSVEKDGEKYFHHAEEAANNLGLSNGVIMAMLREQ